MNIPSLYEQFQKQWGHFQTGWLISDTHFGDEELRAGMPDRPSDEEIVKSINSCVGKNDLLIHLGDVGDVEYVRKLKGYKVLVMGNHDSGASNYKRQFAQKEYNQCWTVEGALADMKKLYPGWKISFHQLSTGYILCNADNGLFDEVYEGPVMIAEKLILSHEPIPNLTWAMNLHGHIHDKRAKTDKNHINHCLDAIEYKPVNLTQKLKQGIATHVVSLHRIIIDKASNKRRLRRKKS